MKKLKLKKVPERGYNRFICCVVSCHNKSEVIDGTKKLSKEDLPLCEKHWEVRCED